MSTPMLMPGMNAIVTNPKNYYHNFTGIVQRVTDGKVRAGGGNKPFDLSAPTGVCGSMRSNAQKGCAAAHKGSLLRSTSGLSSCGLGTQVTLRFTYPAE